MRYNFKGKKKTTDVPDILHIWSIRNEKLGDNDVNLFLRSIKMLDSMVKTNTALDVLMHKRKLYGFISPNWLINVFKMFRNQQSFDQIDIYMILKSQIKTILNMVPKNYEFITFGRERAGLFDPVESLNCQSFIDFMLKSTSGIQVELTKTIEFENQKKENQV